MAFSVYQDPNKMHTRGLEVNEIISKNRKFDQKLDRCNLLVITGKNELAYRGKSFKRLG